MDFVEGFWHVHSKSVVLTVVNRFSKYAHLITLGHLYTATLVERLLGRDRGSAWAAVFHCQRS
jgi:hypothetical protein